MSNQEINPEIIADLVIRLSSLEKLLIDKKIIVAQEYYQEIEKTTEMIMATINRLLKSNKDTITNVSETENKN